jgi:hypothetical protein
MGRLPSPSGRLSKEKLNEIAQGVAERRNMPLNEAKMLLARDAESVPKFSSFVVLETVQSFIKERAEGWFWESEDVKENAFRLQTIPDTAVEKIIRYGNAVERQMSRAYARLDRIQAHRRGERLNATSFDVYLTR